MSALSMMSRICLVMSRTSVLLSLSIVNVFRTIFERLHRGLPSVVLS